MFVSPLKPNSSDFLGTHRSELLPLASIANFAMGNWRREENEEDISESRRSAGEGVVKD